MKKAFALEKNARFLWDREGEEEVRQKKKTITEKLENLFLYRMFLFLFCVELKMNSYKFYLWKKSLEKL